MSVRDQIIETAVNPRATTSVQKPQKYMVLKGARTNNLKNINVDIPLGKMTVITGVSGSGKSSLAFDTLYAEGQRRYVESLSTYTRQFLEKMPKPDIDSLLNICPAIALEQKNTINNSRSTVSTMSELYDYFRLLFAKVGHTFCLNCDIEVLSDTTTTIAKQVALWPEGSRFYALAFVNPALLDKKKWPETKKYFLSNGFERFLIQDEIVELASLENPPVKTVSKTTKKGAASTPDVYLVIDRMSKPEDPEKDARFRDALEQAFTQGAGEIALALVEKERWIYHRFSEKFKCNQCQTEYRKPEPQFFSFNSPLGACAGCSGFGYTLELDENIIVPDQRKTLKDGAVDPFMKPASIEWHHELLKFCEKHKISIGKRYEDLAAEQKSLIWNGDGSKKGFQGIYGCFEELKKRRYKMHIRIFIRRYQSAKLCKECNGTRLKREVSAVKLGEDPQSRRSLPEVLLYSVEDALKYFDGLKLSKYELQIAKDPMAQVLNRLRFLNDVGVGYLTLNRLGKTLSGGECQRINLATQLGNKLCSTLYVLDEPSIGLHAADTDKLIKLLHQLRDHGNTLVVVEHDLDVISKSDYFIEIGPGAGFRGGEIVTSCPIGDVKNQKGSLTAKYLTGEFTLGLRKPREPRKDPKTKETQSIKVVGACENNLKNITVEFPLQTLIAVTGLSGSGKTTLVHKTLYNALARIFHRENLEVGKFSRIYGADLISDVVLLDQKPIGRSARSNPATYLKIWDEIRHVLSNQSASIRKGFTPQFFSFNVDGGRCPVCKGEGEITLDMHFMADIKVPCEECDGKRFKKTVLEVEYKGKNVYQILRSTVDQCYELFREHLSITSKLQILKNVGLGYLELGQSSTTMSGGESQRLKIASVIQNRNTSNVLYIFDEPTTGLHVDDVKRLLSVMHDLVDAKNTVIAIEHNLDFIQNCDWVVDIGPGGGVAGGGLMGAGTPDDVMKMPDSLTGKFMLQKIDFPFNLTNVVQI